MRKRGRKILGLACLLLLIPCTVVLLKQQPAEHMAESADSGRQIVLESGRSVDLETFVLYMTAAQISPSYGPETRKCQAVIARTYLFRELGEETSKAAAELEAAYLDEEEMQKLWGKDYSENYKKLEEAVQATEGQTLCRDGEWVAAVFHGISAGRTRSGGEAFPYLEARDCPEDRLADGYLQTVEYTFREAARRLEEKSGVKVETDFLSDVQIVKRDAGGYVEEVQIGASVFDGDAVAEWLELPSPCFSWEEYQGKLRITCRGRGHGYGLSQWSASQKEEAGCTYKEILQFFFSGAEIQ